MKGNHDYWWSTVNKMNAYLKAEGFDTLHILHNNSYTVEGYAICAVRGAGCLMRRGPRRKGDEPRDRASENELGCRRSRALKSSCSCTIRRCIPAPVPGDRGHPEGVRHQALLLRSSARQRHPVCSAGKGGRHPLQAGKCRRPAFLPRTASINGGPRGQKNEKFKIWYGNCFQSVL